MKDRSQISRTEDPTSGAGPWKHAPIKRAQPRSIGPLCVCMIGVLVAVFGITIITG